MLPTGSLIETVHESTFAAGDADTIAALVTRSLSNEGSSGRAVSSSGNEALGSAIDSLVVAIRERNARLQRTATALQRFHDPQHTQWIMAVHEVLQNASRLSGGDRRETLRDAIPLLQPVIEHPLSGRDYSLRFLMGWLQWKVNDSPSDAVPYFADAARLSAAAGPEDAYPVYSLRHLAYMHSLQGSFAGAYETIQRALQRTSSHAADLELLYEAARYAARANAVDAARDLLTRSLDLSPIAGIWAAHEKDFETAGISVATLLHAASDETEEAVDAATKKWESSLAEVRRVEATLENPITLPASLDESALTEARRQATALRNDHDLVAASALRSAIETAGHDTLVAARAFVEQALADMVTKKSRTTMRIGKLEAELLRWKTTCRALRNEAKQAGFSLTEKPGFRLPMTAGAERRKRIISTQINYATSQENEAEAQRVYDTERPALRAEGKTLQKSINILKAGLTELRTLLGETPVADTPPEGGETGA